MSKDSNKPASELKIPKIIILTGKFLSLISTKFATQFAAKLFATPLRHKIPKRELVMDTRSRQTKLLIPDIGKEVVLYEIGNSNKKILLVHGWSGRGTQLVKIADALLELGYSIVSFDAPAHGKSTGKTTLMPDFIAAILHIEKQYGPFEAAVGHSLGGMSLFNAVRRGLNIRRFVSIGSGDIVQDIIDDFIAKLQMKSTIGDSMRRYFENKSGETMDSFSAYLSAKQINIPVLVIHDKDDDEVPVKCALHLHDHLPHGELMITEGLGHRKILGDSKVISRLTDFIRN